MGTATMGTEMTPDKSLFGKAVNDITTFLRYRDKSDPVEETITRVICPKDYYIFSLDDCEHVYEYVVSEDDHYCTTIAFKAYVEEICHELLNLINKVRLRVDPVTKYKLSCDITLMSGGEILLEKTEEIDEMNIARPDNLRTIDVIGDCVSTAEEIDSARVSLKFNLLAELPGIVHKDVMTEILIEVKKKEGLKVSNHVNPGLI